MFPKYELDMGKKPNPEDMATEREDLYESEEYDDGMGAVCYVLAFAVLVATFLASWAMTESAIKGGAAAAALLALGMFYLGTEDRSHRRGAVLTISSLLVGISSGAVAFWL